MKKSLCFLICIVLVVFSSCRKDDNLSFPDISVNFTSSEVGLDTNKSSENITITLSRKANVDVDVNVSLTVSGVVYGTSFTTNPVATGNSLKVTIPAGSTSASFTVSKVDGAFFEGAENVKFEISSISLTDGIEIGTKKDITLTFGAILSVGDILTLEGKSGDIAFANSVYVDFSSNAQFPIDRKSWNIGLYSGDGYRVVLNGAYSTTATASTKTDIASVTIEDANAAIDIAAPTTSQPGLSITAIDSVDGSLTGTVFAEISETESLNKVYFVASENNKTSRDQWYKVKVSRNGNGYKVQYAKVGETTIKTIQVDKRSGYNFSFLSLENDAIVNVEPEAKKWDIMWSYSAGLAGVKPYFMQDIVLINNIGGAQVVEVSTSTVTYANFKEANLTDLTFSNNRFLIGSNWRKTTATSQVNGVTILQGVFSDRFYVVKDPNGYYYKLRFLKIGLNNDGGERGRPVIEYALVK